MNEKINSTSLQNSSNVAPFHNDVLLLMKSVGRKSMWILKGEPFSLIDEENRSWVISVLWKVLHLTFWWSKNLAETSRKFLTMTWTKVNIDKESQEAIDKFIQGYGWISILPHKEWIFTDYLPLFSQLWDDVLKKCVFYTAPHNLEMNQREFPNLTFRSTAPTKSLIKNIKEDMEKVKNEGWYIFIIPSWDTNDNNASFKGIFNRMLDLWDDSLNILSSNVSYNSPFGYKEVWKSFFRNRFTWANSNEVNISSILTTASEWKWKTWQEQRTFHNSIHSENLKKAA